MEGSQGKVPSASEAALESDLAASSSEHDISNSRDTSAVAATPDESESKTTENPPPPMYEIKGSILKKSSYDDASTATSAPPKSASLSRNHSSIADSSDFNTPDSSTTGTPGGHKRHDSLSKKLKNLRRGSMLRSKGKNRRDHFRHLLMKRKIRAALERKLGSRFSGRAATTDAGAESGGSLADSDCDQEASNRCMSRYQDLKAEVEDEMAHKDTSGKVQEAKLMLKEYYLYAKKAVRHLSVEVRMENLTYSVPISSEAGKVMTVYNSSFLYPVYKFFQRTWRGEKKKPSRIGTKKVLDDINLVLKPGKMYLLLGPPTCGKTTLLRAISGNLHPGKEEKLEGTIKYNGRTLEVCHA
jgi:ABC-type multidrug transport system fused ATPase/permease subunit